MKQAVYQITTENGYTPRFTFTEHHSDGDYGNGNYISVIRGNNELIAYIDMRYTKYVFETFCESYIKQYFGENLLTYERETKHNVYMESGHGARYLLASFDDSGEAVKFCEAHNWSFTDENGFEWNLDIVEVNA